MNKCPQCFYVFSETDGVCLRCGLPEKKGGPGDSSAAGWDRTEATKILADDSMTPERWQKIKGLFEAVQEVPAENRERFLEKLCRDDPALKSDIKRLLAASENAEEFLEDPAIAEVATLFQNQETGAARPATDDTRTGDFVAGTVLADRYRIIGLLGRGGMGEVYRAEDLKLGQTVALKFLPEKLEKNGEALRRFIGEVRTARQVSHGNVCKVYDIGEAGGKHFLSMEYVDGDDLAQLLKRIGRLPADKASEISRQICFGLHAIHDAGILHRDLKPANVIIDSNGRARITDFGIAGVEEEINSAEIRVGTPAYMSPEQITGREVTSRSDIYSLGLLLYEIYTGKQAFKAGSLTDLIDQHRTTQPTDPSELIENIDPVVEKTISRCLEKDPRDRPASALQVALALPGGNPLEAAIAAGETPSPEMVAAAPKKGALKPLAAVGFLAAVVLVFFATVYLNQGYKTHTLTPFEKSPEVLAEKSREIVKKFGYPETPTDADYGFVQDESFLRHHTYFKTEKNSDLPARKEMLRSGQPFHYYFLYRQSPRYLEPVDAVYVREFEPPLDVAGMVNVKLDTRGRLFEFVAVPPQSESKTAERTTDWREFFALAGLDFEGFEPAESAWTPPVFADKRIAWRGTLADFPAVSVRIEAAEYRGQPVYFKTVAPWDLPRREAVAGENPFVTYGTGLIILIICIAIIGSIFLAYRNLKVGRGDLRGGLKLTVFIFVLQILWQAIIADHVPTLWGELSIIYEIMSYAVIAAVVVGLLYIALEPYVRRHWPETLVSWNRVMRGNFRDPMVGRDVLAGGLMGLIHAVAIHLGMFLTRNYLGNFDTVGGDSDPLTLNSTGGLIAAFSADIVGSVSVGLIWLFIAYLFYRLTGRKFLGALSIGVLFFAAQTLFFVLTLHWLIAVAALISSAALVIALWRYGLLGVIAMSFFFYPAWVYALTFDSSRFYFPTSVLAIIITLGIAVFAFYVSIAGQPILGAKAIGETDR